MKYKKIYAGLYEADNGMAIKKIADDYWGIYESLEKALTPHEKHYSWAYSYKKAKESIEKMKYK